MLVLPIHTHGDVLALDDDAAPGRLSVALARPRLARRSDGSSSLRLVRWTTQSSATVATGGRLTLDVEVEAKAEDLDKAGLNGRVTQPLSWLDAKIRLEGPGFETVEAEVSKAIGTAAAISVDLTNLAAGVLTPLLQGQTVSPLQITWIGHVLLRLPPVEVIASADVKEIRRRMDLVEPGRRLTVIRSIIDANARVEIRGAGNPALEQALRDWVLGELNARLDAGRSLDVRASASEVVHRPIQLATTLDDLVPPTARGSIVETIILDPGEVGRVPPVDVRVLADFTGSLERVDVRLTPAASEQIVELAFSSDAPQTARLGTPDFRWSHRVKLQDRPSGPWGPWRNVHDATAVTIPVSAPARLNVEVMAAGLDFAERWQAVRVVLTHAAPESPSQSQTIELTGAQTSANWSAPLEGSRVPLRAQLTYVARQGQSVERVLDNVIGDQVIVTDPLGGNCVPFTLLPVGTGWSEVSLAMVDLHYVDGAYVVDETIELRTLLDFVEWSVPARPDGPQTVQWRLHASFADGRFTSGDWQTADRGAIIVRIDGVPRRTIQVFPIYFDPAVSKSATLRLRSGSQLETLVFTDRTQRNVTLDPGPFSWTIQWTKPDGTPLNETAPQDGQDVLVVPPFRANEA